MKTTTTANTVLAVVLLVLLALAGCDSQTQALSKRITTLEAEVKALKDASEARQDAMKEELATIRASLDSIRSLVKMERERAGLMEQNSTIGESLDRFNDKAKLFVEENLDQLMDTTKKLLDKMDKEIDERMKKQTPAPEGKEI